VAEAWSREALSRPAVVAELRVFAAAAERRLGTDGVQAAMQQGGRSAADGPGQWEGVAGIGRVLAALDAGQRAQAVQEWAHQRQREAERERQEQRHGPQLER
jgi:hypothetical protein